MTTSSDYDGTNLTQQVVTDGSGHTLSSSSFTYDEGGNETKEIDGGVLTTATSYDGGQVTLQTVLDSSDHTVNWQSFSYDEDGNHADDRRRRHDDERQLRRRRTDAGSGDGLCGRR